ncbi:MAG: hypothetical protein CBC42_05995 [Betaproteobacteria bacterium TMED82]|nr:MAG: hypothetical protein CBC42_05995 [Betaproteobacteria bacterium TMED82]
MKIISKIALLLLSMLALFSCDLRKLPPDCTSFLANSAQDRFLIKEESPVAYDKLTRITWYRCNAGQVFNEGKCEGESLKLNWLDAQSYAREFSESSGKIWRLPGYWQMRELQRFDCINPALDTRVFPNLEISHYWSRDEHIFSKRIACSLYTYKSQGYCWQRKRAELPFLLVSDENAQEINMLGRINRVLVDFFN